MRTAPVIAATLVASLAFIAGLTLAKPSSAQDAPAGKATFVGDTECKKCHFQQHKSWKKGTMAKAMKSLQPTAEADNKALFDQAQSEEEGGANHAEDGIGVSHAKQATPRAAAIRRGAPSPVEAR